MSSRPLQPLFLLSDEPIGVSGDDGLNMNQTARVIAEAALGAATPFTVGIFGTWGHGKTSVLNAARTLLEPVGPDGTVTHLYPHIITVQFNAWRYEREPHPIVPLVASIARAIERRLKDDQTLTDAVGEKGVAIFQRVYDGAMSLVGATKIELKGKLGDPLLGQAEGTITVDAAAAQKNRAERAAAREKDAQPKTQTWIDQSLYLSAFDDLAALHAAARKDRANTTRQTPTIVVFIDDLDRCRPESAVEILEGIKLVLAQPGFVFVLALYREVIERYLDRLAEIRYGEKHKNIGEGYVDKIVQLPLWLPSHEAEFEGYIHKLIDTKLKPGLIPPNPKPNDPAVAGAESLLQAIRGCTSQLATLSDHSPRRLVRKINELLIDDHLLPEDSHKALGCEPEERRARLFPLCLIQRALQDLPLPQQVRPLIENDALCDAVAKYKPKLADKADPEGRVGPALFRAALRVAMEKATARDGASESGREKIAPEPLDSVFAKLHRDTLMEWWRATDCLDLDPRRAVILNTSAGRDWLEDHAGRRLVAKSVENRSSAEASSSRGGASDSGPSGGTSPQPAREPAPGASGVSPELLQQMEIIDTQIRKVLGLRSDAPVGPEERARVTRLNFLMEPIDDEGLAWLARADTGLKSLTTLDLGGTKVTDAGVKELARADTGPKSLTKLDLSGTPVTDAGVKELARADTGLKSLTELDLSGTPVTDAGVKELARADTGLKSLTALYLGGTQVTDAGVKELARADTGLKSLTELDLRRTRVTDAGLAELARADTGLKSLTKLDLVGTQVTDAGVKELARADTGLKSLTTLELSATRVTDAGVKELARADTGLKFLTALELSGTQVTDAGLAKLARADTGLKSLTAIYLYGTQVTDAGKLALRQRFPNIKIDR